MLYEESGYLHTCFSFCQRLYSSPFSRPKYNHTTKGTAYLARKLRYIYGIRQEANYHATGSYAKGRN